MKGDDTSALRTSIYFVFVFVSLGPHGQRKVTCPSQRLLFCVSRALRGGRGKEEPLSAIAMVLQAAPGNDGLPPPGPPRHTSAA